MTLPLITPVGSNFLKDWPSQNANNCDVFDAAAGACLTSHALGTYTPAWTASTTDPTMGTGGKQIGYYYLVFDMVYVYSEMRLGNVGFNKGVGNYYMSLPFKAKSLISGSGVPVIGSATAYSNGTPANRQPMETFYQSPTTVSFALRFGTAGATRGVSDITPFTFGALDGIIWSARYQRDLT